MKTKAKMDKWLVVYDDGQEILDAKIAQDRYDAMEEVRSAGEKSGGEIGASVVHLAMAASAPQLVDLLKRAEVCCATAKGGSARALVFDIRAAIAHFMP